MQINRILSVASWETHRQLEEIDAKVVIYLLLTIALTVAATFGGGVASMNEDLYTVGVSSDSEYYGAVTADPQLRAVAPPEGGEPSKTVDVVIAEDGRISSLDSKKGKAALSELENAVDAYNYDQMTHESDVAAAFPVSVQVYYTPQTDASSTVSLGPPDETVSPFELEPPLPFQSLILAFALLIPLNFIIQLYGSAIMEERVSGETELLLSTPTDSTSFIIGKTLPYAVATVGSLAAISLAVGTTVIGFLSVLPLALAFLAFGLAGGVFARSYKELSFLTLGASVFLMALAFIPAMFTGYHPLAAISPLFVVVSQLSGGDATVLQIIMSSLPLGITSLLMFGFGASVYSGEGLLTGRSITSKVLYGIARQVKSWRSHFWLSMVALPFVFLVELMVLPVAFFIPQEFIIPVIFGLVVIIEEVGKSIHIFAGFTEGKLAPTKRNAVIAGVVSGFGFMIAEKGLVVAQSTLISSGLLSASSPSSSVSSGIILLIAPVLHSITTTVSALGARTGKRKHYIAALGLACAIHFVYNISAVILYA